MLIGFVFLYLILSIGIGMYAATKVHSARDYITAGRSLPMYIVLAMVFATWFGAETVLGIPATFMEEDLGGLISDPFGASLCLVLFGLFFARKLYRMNLLTIGDFYRQRYGHKVEVIAGIAIALSYLGWVSAQVTALGLVFDVLSDGQITQAQGILIRPPVVLLPPHSPPLLPPTPSPAQRTAFISISFHPPCAIFHASSKNDEKYAGAK